MNIVIINPSTLLILNRFLFQKEIQFYNENMLINYYRNIIAEISHTLLSLTWNIKKLSIVSYSYNQSIHTRSVESSIS